MVSRLTDNNAIYSVVKKTDGIKAITTEINRLIKEKEQDKEKRNLEKNIRKELLYLGYDISLKGTRYLIDVIEYVAKLQQEDINSLIKDVFPVIAKRYKITPHNLKCSINRANTSMYFNCEERKLKEYFSVDEDIKPTTKMIILTIINKIKNGEINCIKL